MKFGRIHDVSGVDFTLPPQDPRSAATLRETARSGRGLSVRLGCPVWTAQAWQGTLFPPGTPRAKYLEVYGRALSGVELNSTFYALPAPETFTRWATQVGDGFRFFPKVPSEVSRALARGLVNRRLLDDFVARVALLGDRMGTCFLQLPPLVGPNELAAVRGVLEAFLDVPASVAVEARHPGLFRAGRMIPKLAGLLADYGATTVITDCAGRRDVCHATLTGAHVHVRFAGDGLIASDYARIDAWAERIQAWAEAGLASLAFIVHQPLEQGGPALCRYLADRLNERLELTLSVGKPAEQLSLFAE